MTVQHSSNSFPAGTRQVVIGALLLAMLSTLAACGKSNSAPSKEVTLRSVTIGAVTEGPESPAIEVTGVVQNRDEAKLAFKVGGVIRDVLVREGDTVKAGQVLATLMADEVDASVTQADENYNKAKRDLERGKRLYAEDVVTKAQLDDLQTAEAVAQAGVRAARFNRGTAQIVASASGTVLARLAQPKEVIGAGQPVLLLGDISKGFVIKAGLTDRQVVRVKRGDALQVSLDAVPDKTFAGQVLEVGLSADPRVGTYRLEGQLKLSADETKMVLPGMVGRVKAMTATGPQLTYIPLTALIEGDQKKAWVFVAQPNGASKGQYVVKRTEVEPAFIQANTVALKAPLPAGSHVVTSGVTFLNDGETVMVNQGAAK